MSIVEEASERCKKTVADDLEIKWMYMDGIEEGKETVSRVAFANSLSTVVVVFV